MTVLQPTSDEAGADAAAGVGRARRPWLRPSRLALIGILVDIVAVLGTGYDAARRSRGMDVSYDLLNYHYYYSYLLTHGLLSSADPEPFANRYLNPLPELPWYLLDQAFDPRMSSAAIGLVAGLNLPLVRRITAGVLPERITPRAGLALSSIAMILAAIGTDFRIEVGSSLADIVLSVPALGAVLLLVRAAQSSSSGRIRWPIVFAGLLSGLAFGAKLTMLSYVVALFVAVSLHALLRRRPWDVITHAIGVLVGVAAAGGWWFWSMWRLTGSPVFPYYNSIFGSSKWVGPDLHDARYGPHGLLDALKYPLYMWRGTRRLVDVKIQDGRWMVLVVLAALAAAVAVVRMFHGRANRQPATDAVRSAEPVVLLAAFGVVGSVLWLFEFGISRYGIVSEMLAGPAIVLLVLVVVRRAWLTSALAVVIALVLYPTVQGYFLHRPFQRNRYMVHAAPLRAVPPGSVVLSDAGSGPNSFLLTDLPAGVRRHVVHPWFYGQPVLRNLETGQLATAPHIYVIESAQYRLRVATLERFVGIRLETGSCTTIRTVTQPRFLCRATYLGPTPVRKPGGTP